MAPMRFGYEVPLLFALTAALGACSVLLDNSPVQCTTTAECLAHGPAFEHSFCSARHACEPACTTNSQCALGDRDNPRLCRGGRCVNLKSDDCQSILTYQADPLD